MPERSKNAAKKASKNTSRLKFLESMKVYISMRKGTFKTKLIKNSLLSQENYPVLKVSMSPFLSLGNGKPASFPTLN